MTQSIDDDVNIETILPYGESLRPLIVSSFLSKSDLKNFLANRGIFVCNYEKEVTIPLISSLLISPKEFDNLRDKQRVKEDNIKRTSQNIQWGSETTLVQAVENDQLNFDLLIPEHSTNYHVVNAPILKAEDENTLVLEYEIEREDKTKDWANARSKHEGKIKLRKTSDGNKLEIEMEYTSTETKDLNNKVVKYLIKDFKDKNHIARESLIQKISFGDFTNAKRIEFLLSLHHDELDLLSFKEVTNIEIGPDLEAGVDLPLNINWMHNIRNIILKGQHLHDTILIKENEYHEALIFETIEAIYEFNYSGAKGTCIIEYGFSNYLKTKDRSTEFEIRIVRIKLAKKFEKVSKKQVNKFLLNRFDEMKKDRFEKFTNEN